MSRVKSLSTTVVVAVVVVAAAPAALTFQPAAGSSVQEVWAGSYGAHFAPHGADLFIYGAEPIGGNQWQSVVRVFDGVTTTEVARSATYAAGTYYPDAITVCGGAVYWAHVQSYSAGGAATIYKTVHDGMSWETSEILATSAGVNVYSLSTDGVHVLGTGVGASGDNVAFYLDDVGSYQVLADLPVYSGGTGFDLAGNFYAGAMDAGYAAHMYRFSAQQITDRLSGAQPTPYTTADALADYLVPDNASPVMESDGAKLYGTQYLWGSGAVQPYAYDLAGGASTSLGTLSGADTLVTTDLYYRDGAVWLMGKSGWTTGAEAAIYRLVPEPGALALLLVGFAVARRRG